MNLALTVFLFLPSLTLFSQDKETIPVDNNDLSTTITGSYYYPKFISGIVHFKDGTRSTAPLNYNLLFNQVHFLASKGDTLSVTDVDNVDWVVINQDSFCYSKGFYLLLKNSKYVKLVSGESLHRISNVKRGGYGQPTESSAIDNYSSYNTGTQNVKLSVNATASYKKDINFYLIDPDNNSIRVSKKGFLRVFPKYSSDIENYLSRHNVDFKSKKDVEALFDFIVSYRL